MFCGCNHYIIICVILINKFKQTLKGTYIEVLYKDI